MNRRILIPPFLFFGYFAALWTVLAYAPIHFTELGFTHFQIGTLISFFPLSSLLLVIPFGIFSDRLSPKMLTIAGLFIFASFLSLLPHLSDFSTLIPLFLLGGIGGSLFLISCSSLYYKTMGSSNRGKKLGFFSGVGLSGYCIGPLIGGFIFSSFGIHKVFLFVSIAILPFCILSFFLQDAKLFRFQLRKYREDLLKKNVLILAILTFLISFHIGVEHTSFSLFLNKNVGLSPKDIGFLFFLVGLAIVVACFINGFILDMGPSLGIFLYLGLLFSGFFNISLLFATSFISVLFLRLLHVTGDSIFMISQRVAISDIFLAERIGGSLGVMNTVFTAGIFTGAICSGLIPGYLLPFVVAGSLAILAIPPAVFLRPKFS